jgi:hypothetical protein
MDPSLLNDISRRIRKLDTRRLTGRISRYVHLSAAADESLRRPDLDGGRVMDRLAACCWELFGEIPILIKSVTEIREQMVDLHHEENEKNAAPPEIGEASRRCFDGLKRHGMELLAHLTDEIGIVQETLKQGERVRRIVADHTDPMKRSATLLDILLERFAHRPTVAYRVGGESADIRQLEYAVEGMENWEATADSENDGSAESLRVATLSPYGRVIQSMWEELEQRGRKIADADAELKEGWRLLHRLSAKGYSRKIRQEAEKLSFRHEARRRAFQKFIRESRAAAPGRRRAG